jgi:3-oxoacyl-(acyl-carrier-protein) synthase
MSIYINGIGCVSPQKTWERDSFLEEVQEYDARMIQCMEPEVDPGLDEKYLRRMNRLIRLGWTAAKICLDDAGNPKPDAIITGSGWGSVQDSEKFLLSIYKNKEIFLPPTPFIQSTHNALGSQIAILLECYHYNMAYAHSSHAFLHALEDAMLRMQLGESQKVLVGGFDEVTPNQFTLYDRIGWWRKEPVHSLRLLEDKKPGSVCGEGFGFFLLETERNANTYAELVATPARLGHSGGDSQIIKDTKIDWVFAGYSGDSQYDGAIDEAIAEMFPGGVNVAAYKHLCGEYLTSSAFALWAAAKALKHQRVPEIMQLKIHKKAEAIGNILIFNLFKGNEVGCILLTKPK